MLKTLLAAVIGLGVATLALPANAFLAEVATSIPAATVGDDEQLQAALQSAVKDVLEQAIAFKPSLVQLQDVRRVGDRIYLLFLVADSDGENTLRTFEATEPASTDSPSGLVK
jgi:hypothetical protein